MNKESLEEALSAHGQSHVLKFWDQLTDDEKRSFSKELDDIDCSVVSRDFGLCMEELNCQKEKKDEFLEAIQEDLICRKQHEDPARIVEWWDIGLQNVSKGKVALLLMAGGMGTRLGVSYPKGMYNVGLPSGKSLYQLQAERLVHLQEMACAKYGSEGGIRWYIMTSEATDKSTEEFLRSHNYFGLDSDNVVMFPQGSYPCLTLDGKLMLESKGSLAKSPDGNGGLYAALKKHNIIQDMERHGVEYLFAYCVDNILVRVADPVFMGYCIQQGLDCANKVVEKVDPTEAVGITCKCKGKYQVVEYSEISPETAMRRRDDGSLAFCNGNICNHFFTRKFLEKVTNHHLDDLPRHVAKKKIPYVNSDGELVKPNAPNGIKLEKFVFDVFQFAENFAVFEVQRGDEFSPLKNAEGKDSPVTCRGDLLRLHRKMVELAGGKFVYDDGNVVLDTSGVDVICEVSPLLSYAGENLEAFVRGKSFKASVTHHLTPDSVACQNGPTEGKRSKCDV